MDSIFDSILNLKLDVYTFLILLGSGLLLGIIFSALCYIKGEESKGFHVTLCIIPAAVALFVVLASDSLGIGLALGGSLALVRFRSVKATGKELAMIIIDMAIGCLLGTGYVAFAVIVTLVLGGVLVLFNFIKLFDRKPVAVDKKVDITIPEDLNYTEVFDEIFSKYTSKHLIVRVKTINLGSMYRITYHLTLNDANQEKEFIDAIRERNGNLEVSSSLLALYGKEAEEL